MQTDFSSSDPRLRDKDFRLSHFYKITDKDGAISTFIPNSAQRHFHQSRHNRNIILKSRRLGFTTDSCMDMLDETLFNKFFFSLFISYDDPSSKKVFSDIIKLAWDHFPLRHLYQIDTSSSNALKVLFDEGVFSLIEVKTSARGGRTSFLHVSEFGKICDRFPDKATEILSGSIPSLIPNGKLIIESTAVGETGSFHDMFWDAWDNPFSTRSPHEYKAFFYNWQWDEWEISRIRIPDPSIPKQFREYQQKHNELAKRSPVLYQPITDIQLTYWYHKFVELGKRWDILFENYPTTPQEAFVSSGKKMFDQLKIQELMEKAQDPIRINGDWRIYQDSIKTHNYVIGADVAEGVGGDHSAAAILDISTPYPTLVATYKSNEIPPDHFAYELRNLGELYNTAFIAPERNQQGYATVTKLKDIYPDDKIYHEEKEDRDEEHISDRFGWVTNKATKPKMLYDLSSAVTNDYIVIKAKEVLQEMRVFDKHDVIHKSSTELTSKHYDLLISLAIAYQAATQAREASSGIITVSPLSQSNSSPFAGI